MNDQQIIIDQGMPAASLESVLAAVGADQTLCCHFEEGIGKWCCTTYQTVGHEPTGYGVGSTLAAALADLHPPIWSIKTVRDADFGERGWTTEEDLA